MQRRKSSRIVSSDFPTLGGRNQGTYILQSHGTNVNRGDLITQDNIIPDPEEPEDLFTITINKDNYSQLCTIGNPDSLTQGPPESVSDGTFTTDSTGILLQSYGGGSQWHGPAFYTILPYAFGEPNKYWYIKIQYDAIDNGSMYISLGFGIGSILYAYTDGGTGHSYDVHMRSGSTATRLCVGKLYNQYVDDVLKVYHTQDNRTKVYYNGNIVFNDADPIVPKGDKVLWQQILVYGAPQIPPHHIKEITVSTDPSYDPQP